MQNSKKLKKYDIVIVGASFAGLTLAHHLPREMSVLILERKKAVDDYVESTGLVTTTTYELLKDFIDIDQFVPNRVDRIAVVSPDYNKYFISKSQEPWIYTTDTRALMAHLAKTTPSNVTVLTKAHFKDFEVMDGDQSVRVNYSQNNQAQTIEAKFIVGADGANSRVAAINPNLSQNETFLAGLEKEYYGSINLGDNPEKTVYHFWFGQFSLGYGGWLSPTLVDGKKGFRVGLAKRAKDKGGPEKLKQFLQILDDKKIVSIKPDTECAHAFGSMIPIGGVLKNISDQHSALIGDAAGLCGAFAADGIKGALLSAKIMAKLIPDHLNGDTEALSRYKAEIEKFQKLLTYYKKQVLYRWVWDRMKRDHTFHAMYDIIAAEKESFLDQYCNSRADGKGLSSVLIRPKHSLKLLKFGLFLLGDILWPWVKDRR